MQPPSSNLVEKRTLQRKLDPEETTCQEVLKGVRKEQAKHYLKDPRLTATEISYLIGFEDASSFFRASWDRGSWRVIVADQALTSRLAQVNRCCLGVDRART